MAIFVIGVNHKTAPVAVRERIYFALDKLPLYLQDLLSAGVAKDAVLLSTCNRSELYCEAEDYNLVHDWFIAQTPIPAQELSSALYHYEGREALAHMMEVAVGLDSMVLGEPQIFGQMKTAFSESCAALAVGPAFQRLFQYIFSIAKEIRTTTAIGACPVSMISAAVHFAKKKLPQFADKTVGVVGAGETAQLLLRYLTDMIQKPILLINRQPEKAFLALQHLKDRVHVCGFEGMPKLLQRADLIFTMTGSAKPILHRAMFDSKRDHTHPLTLIDIAVPRDVAPDVANVAHVDLYCIDDLKNTIEVNRQGREHAATKARERIQQLSLEVFAEYQSFDHVAYTIRAYRKQIEDICSDEIRKAELMLAKGKDPRLVLQAFAYAYTNKLLHEPSVQLRQAGVEGRFELLRYAKQLFAIPDLELEHI